MDNLVVHSKLATSVVDDQDTNTASAIGKGVIESRPQTTLVNDRKTLLDISSLSHGDNAAIVTHVEDAVLLEDGTEHVLDDDRGRRVGHEARLLMKLLGEKVDAEVAVLASLSRGGDANDLARTTLEDQQIADADVVARDRDGVGADRALDEADVFTDTLANASWAVVLIDDYLLTLMAMLVLRVEGMEDTVRGFLDAVAEGMIATVVVVVTHV